MAETEPTFKIPRDVIEPIIQAHVQKAVIDALADRGALVSEAVRRVLSMKVDTEGRFDSYGRGGEWVAWMVRDCICKATRAAIEDEMVKHKVAIDNLIIKELQKRNSPLMRQLVNGMTSAFTNPENLKWRLKVSYEEPTKE